ncbi:MAG TPA: hypothetical protein VGN18_06050 [Jatrophihabitans sp.]|jgi:hypothetical protein|uniref:Acg family FMN-binding oxidoreductase n=1 Tax=Jatrophihabitans sp. TaxID=1932789 RepID=UPI002DFC9AF1|nr:hypothetical protein [Jatrophihabitans sp.]
MTTTAATSAIATILRRAALRAMRAPSVHNTQPWTFTLGKNSLEIRADLGRQLSVLDPRGRQLIMSCGCALFNARVAIAAAGYEPVVERYPDPAHPELVARLTVGDARGWQAIAALDLAIDQRRTNRRAFAPEPVPPSVVGDLVQAARAEGAILVPITSVEHRLATARLSKLADQIEHADPAYRDELRAWTTDDPRRRDGVQAASVPYAGTGAASDDPLPIREFDVRGMGWLPSSSHSDVDQCLLLLCSIQDSAPSWLRAGEALEHLWLELTRQGYWATPLAQVVEVGATHEELRAELDLDVHPEILLRVGRAPDTVRTQRRHPMDIIFEP